MSFLNLFGGGDSTSSTSTTNNTQTNQRLDPTTIATGNGFALSTTTNGDGNYTTNNITTLDAGLASHGYDTILTATQDALLFGANAEKNSYGFATHALDASLGFAATSNATTMAFADAQVKTSNATTASALGSANDAFTKALSFGSHQTGVALDALAGSAHMIDTAYKDAKGVLGTNVILVGIGAVVLVLYFALGRHK